MLACTHMLYFKLPPFMAKQATVNVFLNLYRYAQHTLRVTGPAMNEFTMWEVCVSIAVICCATIILLLIAQVTPLRTLHVPETQKVGEEVITILEVYPVRTYSAFGSSIDLASARNGLTRTAVCQVSKDPTSRCAAGMKYVQGHDNH